MNDVESVLKKHPRAGRDALIPILQEVQESQGYLSKEAVTRIGKHLNLPVTKIYGVATFYNQFRFQPKGKYHIMVCRGTACHVRGGARILQEIEHRLGIKPGETTKDMEYTLETVSCIGACALAPNVTVGKELHGQLTTKKISEVIGDRSKSEKSEK